MTGVQTCALPICFPVTIGGLEEEKFNEIYVRVRAGGLADFFQRLRLIDVVNFSDLSIIGPDIYQTEKETTPIRRSRSQTPKPPAKPQELQYRIVLPTVQIPGTVRWILIWCCCS